MSTRGWEDRLSRRIEETNDRIAALNSALPADVNEFYTVPTNPTAAHIDRMQSDLDELVTDSVAPGTANATTVEHHYEQVLDGLDEIHSFVRKHNIPRPPNYGRR